jgi:hypothetical protein
MIKRKLSVLLLLMITGLVSLQAQSNGASYEPQTVLEFLDYSIDSRSSAMGAAGIATSGDIYAYNNNPSKYLFDNVKGGIGVSYTPWMRNLVKDMFIMSVGGHYIIDSVQSISASCRGFSLGNITFRDQQGERTNSANPYQLSFDAAYSRKLSEYFSASIAFRASMADLFQRVDGYNVGYGVTGDLSVYFNKGITFISLPSKITAGASLTNIGTKVSFRKNSGSYFMPAAFRLGFALTSNLDNDNSLMIAGEMMRSLVPTKVENLDDSSIGGIFSSISEGNWNSMGWSIGAEYSYSKLIFGRMGYHYESELHGMRQNLAFGVGMALNFFNLDFSYLVPTGSYNDSMGNIIRVSLAFKL